MNAMKTPRALPNAKDILAQELAAAKWHEQTDPDKALAALDDCLQKTYTRVRSACWGNHVRTMACDTLFSQARKGIALAKATVGALDVTQVADGGQGRAAKSAFLCLGLLALGTALALWASMRTLRLFSVIMGILAALCLGAGIYMEVRRMMQEGVIAETIRHALARLPKVIRRAKWLAALQRQASPAQTAEMQTVIKLDANALEAACMAQMEVIDSNLALFDDPVSTASDHGEMMPLVRVMLQQKYAAQQPFEESIEITLKQYLQARGLTLVDYDDAHAHLFQTQPMDETFTIFPAIVGGQGQIVEHGLAGVRE